MRRKTLILWALLLCFCWAQGSLYDQAMELYLKGQHAPALELFEKARQQKDLPEYSLWIGWCQLRLGRLEAAQSAFEKVLAALPGQAEALTGLGYLGLRREQLEAAEKAFSSALQGQPANKDALTGLALVYFRRNQLSQSRVYAEKVLALDPANETVLDLMKKLAEVEEPEAAYPARRTLSRAPVTLIPFRAGKKYFEQGPEWKPFFVQGMNLGPALPGRFPSQFPQPRALYLDWLKQMSEMGCNVVRVYTVLPPGFYQAFWEYQQQPDHRPLWLVHGVWAEEPPANNYQDPDYDREFCQEIENVTDLLHGQVDLEARPGHAWGSYTADVSPWVLAILLGREWEPYTVEGFNRLYPGYRYAGKYVSSGPECSPMEGWMARLCDRTVDYEMQKYNCQRPISFTNWPTLDPLKHSSEASKAEVSGILAARGEYNPVKSREYDNDVEGITSNHLVAERAFPAGLYASYHAYPYYPDFLINQPEYMRSSSNYAGYLQQLKGYYSDKPLLIAEYGVPSSRGNCHLQPQGLHHGGHSEVEQGQQDALLTQEIWDNGCAGAIVFAWIDEWFKKNWLVVDREIPLERNRLWLNYLDAEQNYGMLAARPAPSEGKTLQCRAEEWKTPPLVPRFWVESDEGFLYLRWDLEQQLGDCQIGINTIWPQVGEHRLPGLAEDVEVGMEFLLSIHGDQAELKVARDYRPYVEVAGPPSLGSALAPNPQMLPRDRWAGDFVPIEVESNRARIGRDGTNYPAQRQTWGRLLRGSLNPLASDYDTRADWHYDRELRRLEIRLPWGLLGVTDPSSRRVICEPWESVTIDTRTTEGFRFVLWQPGDLKPRTTPNYLWSTWDKPTYHMQRKPSFGEMRREFEKLGGRTK